MREAMSTASSRMSTPWYRTHTILLGRGTMVMGHIDILIAYEDGTLSLSGTLVQANVVEQMFRRF